MKVGSVSRNMNLNKNDYSALFNEFEISKAIKKGQITIQDYVRNHIDNDELYNVSDRISKIKRTDDSTPQEKIKDFIDFNHRIFSKIYGNFKVEIITDSFFNNLQCCTIESILNTHMLYDLFGECSGIMLFPGKCIVEYAILKEGSFMRYIGEGDSYDGWAHFSYIIGGIEKQWYETNNIHYFFLTTLEVLIMKKYGDIETVLVAKETTRTIGQEKVANRMPFPVHRLDSSYFKTIIRTEGFLVRSHWRLQPCGKGRKERKLIFINAFQKKGYVRRAPALIARRAA